VSWLWIGVAATRDMALNLRGLPKWLPGFGRLVSEGAVRRHLAIDEIITHGSPKTNRLLLATSCPNGNLIRDKMHLHGKALAADEVLARMRCRSVAS
jgi:hypothetical protein